MLNNDMDLVKFQFRNSLTQGMKKVDPKAEKELKEACEGFEAVFTKKLVESMRATLPGDGLFPESNSMEIFQSMYDNHLSDKMAGSATGVGLKDYLYNQLKSSLPASFKTSG